jgi:hypothetical protein
LYGEIRTRQLLAFAPRRTGAGATQFIVLIVRVGVSKRNALQQPKH